MPLAIFKFKKIKSTNDRAIQNIKRGIQKGIIVSDQQTSGRGTYGKKWVSFKGNLFVSFFFEIKKKINLKRITLINFNIIKECLQKIISKKIIKKYPNDLMVNNKKICGILQEIINFKNRKYLIIGIGVNIVKSPKIDKYPTTFINNFLNKKISKNIVFNCLKINYEKKIKKF